MTGGAAFDLSAAEIVRAAADILAEQGLDAVSMRTVATRLGVSPVPLYSRVGNKEALLDAVAEHLLTDAAPRTDDGETWQRYTIRWATVLRGRLTTVRDVRRLLHGRQAPLVPAASVLVAVLRDRGGFTGRQAVEVVQLICWAVLGYTAYAPPEEDETRTLLRGRPAPWTVTEAQTDHLFELHIRYLVEGVERDRLAGTGDG